MIQTRLLWATGCPSIMVFVWRLGRCRWNVRSIRHPPVSSIPNSFLLVHVGAHNRCAYIPSNLDQTCLIFMKYWSQTWMHSLVSTYAVTGLRAMRKTRKMQIAFGLRTVLVIALVDSDWFAHNCQFRWRMGWRTQTDASLCNLRWRMGLWIWRDVLAGNPPRAWHHKQQRY